MKIIYNYKYKYYECFFYYKQNGIRKQKHKRGFKSQKECKDFERDFLNRLNFSSDIAFSSLCDLYFEDRKARLKPTTLHNLGFFMNRYKEYFHDMPLDSITPSIIRDWQNKLLQKGYEQTTARLLNSRLSSLFEYGIKFLNLKSNPVSIAGSIGAMKPRREIQIWTPEQFQKFLTHINKPLYFALFNLLFWTGIRIGEALALTENDFDFENKTLSINKSLARIHKKDIIQAPKTQKSKRKIVLPDILIPILKKYLSECPFKRDLQVFPTKQSSVGFMIKSHAKRENLPIIRTHDLRHSHASLLINNGVNIAAVSERLGHDNIRTTLNVYAHLMDNTKMDLVTKLNEITSKNKNTE